MGEMTPDAASLSKKLITVSSIARMAGNIASGMVANPQFNDSIDLQVIAANSVKLAYLINAEIEKCEKCR